MSRVLLFQICLKFMCLVIWSSVVLESAFSTLTVGECLARFFIVALRWASIGAASQLTVCAEKPLLFHLLYIGEYTLNLL